MEGGSFKYGPPASDYMALHLNKAVVLFDGHGLKNLKTHLTESELELTQ